MNTLKKILAIGIIAALLPAEINAAKSSHALVKATDAKKIQALIRSTNYKKVTENDYVAVRQHLVSLVKACDISTDEGRRTAAILYLAVINFGQYSRNPDGNRDHVTQGWQDMKAGDFEKDLRGMNAEQFHKMVDEKYPTDEIKLREEFQSARKPK